MQSRRLFSCGMTEQEMYDYAQSDTAKAASEFIRAAFERRREAARTNPSILFRSADSGSLITITWKDGLVYKSYNGRIAGRKWPLSGRPATAETFEQWCRSTFLLSSTWNVRHVTGFETTREEVA
jgi:hypothetical protein